MKDGKALKAVLHDDVTLSDWETNIAGRNNVVSLANRLFVDFLQFTIEVLKISSSDNYVSAEIKIKLSKVLDLNVVDIFIISAGKIKSIKADKR